MYAAFGRGDIPAILNQLSESVTWDDDSSVTDVPWLQPRRGRAQVADFFTALGGLEIELFQPTAFLEQGNIVVALIDIKAKVKATGRPFVQSDETHIWRFDAHGRVVSFRHRVDTHQQVLAWSR